MPNTLEIRKLQEPNGLATAISEKYIAWESSKQRWYDNAKETLENLYATSTSDIYNQTREFDNTTHIPKLTQIRDMLVTYYLDAMFSLPDYVEWEAHNMESANVETKNRIKAIIRQMLESSQFKPVIRQAVEDYVDYGNAFLTAVPVQEKLPSSILYTGPKAVRINPMDIYFDPTAVDFASAPKIIRTVLTLGELIQSADRFSADENVFKKALNKALKKRSVIRNTISTNTRDMIVDDMVHIAGFDSWSTYYNSDTVEILTFYGDLYDIDSNKLYKNSRIIVMDRCDILLNEPIQDHGFKCNIFKAGWRDRKDNLWSMSPLDNIKGMQFMIDFLENKRADVFNFISNPIIVTQGDVEMPEYTYPGCHIGVDNDGNVQFIRPDATALQADLYIDRYLNLMEEMAGTPREAMGFRTPGEKTAFEVSTLNTAASRLFNDKVHKFEQELLEPIITLMFRMLLEDENRVLSVKTTNQYGAEVFEDVPLNEVVAAGTLKAIGSTTYTEKAKMAQTLLQYYNSGLAADPLVNNWFDPKQIAKILAYTTGFDKFNGFIKENARIMAELEMKSVAESATQVLEEQQVRGIQNAQQAIV